MFEKFKILAILVNYVGLWKDTAFLLALATNILVLSSTDYTDGEIYVPPGMALLKGGIWIAITVVKSGIL